MHVRCHWLTFFCSLFPSHWNRRWSKVFYSQYASFSLQTCTPSLGHPYFPPLSACSFYSYSHSHSYLPFSFHPLCLSTPKCSKGNKRANDHNYNFPIGIFPLTPFLLHIIHHFPFTNYLFLSTTLFLHLWLQKCNTFPHHFYFSYLKCNTFLLILSLPDDSQQGVQSDWLPAANRAVERVSRILFQGKR